MSPTACPADHVRQLARSPTSHVSLRSNIPGLRMSHRSQITSVPHITREENILRSAMSNRSYGTCRPKERGRTGRELICPVCEIYPGCKSRHGDFLFLSQRGQQIIRFLP
ncbi:unnamed protein product [Ectocarpus sp. 12 AP-2014]